MTTPAKTQTLCERCGMVHYSTLPKHMLAYFWFMLLCTAAFLGIVAICLAMILLRSAAYYLLPGVTAGFAVWLFWPILEMTWSHRHEVPK